MLTSTDSKTRQQNEAELQLKLKQIATVQQIALQAMGFRAAPQISGFLHNGEQVIFLLAKPSRAPEGIQYSKSGSTWSLSLDSISSWESATNSQQQSDPTCRYSGSHSGTQAAARSGARSVAEQQDFNTRSFGSLSPANPPLLAPLVIHAGKLPNEGADMFLNLGHLSHISVKGNSEETVKAMKLFVTDLLFDPARNDIQLFLIGFGRELEIFPQVNVCERLSDALEQIPSVKKAYHFRRTSYLFDSVAQPYSVVLDPFTDRPELPQVAGMAALASFGDARFAIEVRQQSLSLQPWDVNLMRPAKKPVTEVSYSTFSRLLEQHDAKDAMRRRAKFARSPHVKSSHVKSSKLSYCPSNRVSRHRQQELPAFARASGIAQIRVLGQVDLVGSTLLLTQQMLDFVCFLAFHREGASGEMLQSALWPKLQSPSIRTVTSLASRTRKILGKDFNNRMLLSKAGAQKLYKLSSEITTDFDEFCSLVRSARGNSPVDVLYLRRALRLVRGVPFSSPNPRRYGWADKYARGQMECLIDEAAHKLVDLALKFSDTDTARWACYQVHKIVPGCEQCYLRRFRVAAASGSQSELQSTMAELELLLSQDEFFSVSENLRQNYEQLLAAF